MSVSTRKFLLENWISLGQLLIAALMCWSLYLSRESLNLTQLQIEATNAPEIKVSSYDSNLLTLINTGGVEIANIKGVTKFTSLYDRKTSELSIYLISSLFKPKIFAKSLKPNQECSINLDELIPSDHGHAIMEKMLMAADCVAVTFVFKYNRTADGKTFYKVVSFYPAMDYSQKDNYEKGAITNYQIFTPVENSLVISSTKLSTSKLRENIRKVLSDRLEIDLEMHSGN